MYQETLHNSMSPDKLFGTILTMIHDNRYPFRIFHKFIDVLQTEQTMDNVRLQLEESYYSWLPMKLKADWSTDNHNNVSITLTLVDNRTVDGNQIKLYLNVINPPSTQTRDTLLRANQMEGIVNVNLQEETTCTYKTVEINSQEQGSIKLTLCLHQSNQEYTFQFTLWSISNSNHRIRVEKTQCEGATVNITVPGPLVTEGFIKNSGCDVYTVDNRPSQPSTLNETRSTHCSSNGHTAIVMDKVYGGPPAVVQNSNSHINNYEHETTRHTVICKDTRLTTRQDKRSLTTTNTDHDRWFRLNIPQDVQAISITFSSIHSECREDQSESNLDRATECDSSDETHYQQDVSEERTNVTVQTVREISVLQMEYTCILTGPEFDKTCEQYRLAIVSNDWRQTEILTAEIVSDSNRTTVEKAFFRCYHGIELTNAGKKESAIFELKQVLEQSREEDSHNMQLVKGRAHRIMAGILVKQHQTKEALEHINKSKEALRTAKPSCEKACMLVKEAEILLQSREGTESRDYIERLLEGAHQNTVKCNDRKRKELKMPMVCIEKALFYTSEQGKPWYSVRKENLKLSTAKTCLDEYSKCPNIKGRNVYHLKFLTAMSDYHRLSGKWHKALEFITEAVNLQDSANLDGGELCIAEKNACLKKKME